MENKENHRGTCRVLDILEFISKSENGYTMTEICKAIQAPKSSIFPILHTLVNRGFLSLNLADSKYYIDQMAFEVGSAYLERFHILDEVEKEMRNMVNVCTETCHLGKLDHGDVLYLKKIDSPEAIRMISTVGHRLPAYGTGLGKALLADYEIAELKKLYPAGLQPLTPHTIVDFEELAAQLKKVQREGFSYECEESNQYIRCIGTPIRQEGKIVAALSIAVPVFRYSEEKADLIRHLLANARKKIESMMVRTGCSFFR